MSDNERLTDAARSRVERERRWREEGEVSFALRLGRISFLGLLVVTSTLAGMLAGR